MNRFNFGFLILLGSLIVTGTRYTTTASACTPNYVSDFNKTRDTYNHFLKWLDKLESQGESFLRKISEYPKTAILVFSDSGSWTEKTTLSDLIKGNFSELREHRNARLVKLDSWIPEYAVSSGNNMEFYICPGFNTSRSPAEDIVAQAFLKSVTNHLEKTKILWTIEHSSVTAKNYSDFETFSTFAVKFSKKFETFRNSIGLIVTTVNSYSKTGEFLEDAEILSKILEFLLKFRDIQQQSLRTNNFSTEKQIDIRNKIEFMNALLTQNDNGQYSKIWFLRNLESCHDKCKSVQYLTKVRRQISELYSNALSFATVNSSDFGFIVMNDTRLKLEKYFPAIVFKIKNSTAEILNILHSTYETNLQSKLAVHETRRNGVSKLNHSYKTLVELLQHVRNETSSLKDTHFQELQEIFHVIYFGNRNLDEDLYMKKILWGESFLQFSTSVLEKNITCEEVSPTLWIVQDSVEKMHVVRDSTWKRIQDEFVPDLYIKVQQTSIAATKRLEDLYFNKVYKSLNRTSIHPFALKLQSDHESIQKYLETVETGFLSISREMEILYSILGFDVETEDVKDFSTIDDLLTFYEKLTNVKFRKPYNEFVSPVEKFSEKLKSSAIWYEFLQKVNAKLALLVSSQVKRNTSTEIELENVNGILNLLEEEELIDVPMNIKNISGGSLNLGDKKLLYDIVSYAIFEKTITHCQTSDDRFQMLVTGRFVKFSDFLTNSVLSCEDSGKLNVTDLHVFASETVFIDEDLLARGKGLNVAVIARNWVVVAEENPESASKIYRRIILDGKHGESFYDTQPRAYSGSDYGNDGDNGLPGKPGGNGGNFFGIYSKLVNGQLLQVSADGGDGGEGQKGGHGFRGRDGRNATREDFPSAYMQTTDKKFESYGLSIPVLYNSRVFRKLGRPGGKGGNGGDGGIGGVGGYYGFIEIFSVSGNRSQDSNSSLFRKSSKLGHVGSPAEGGYGGIGGMYGNSHECVLKSLTLALWWDQCKDLQNSTTGEKGRTGIDGGNSLGQILPERVTPQTNRWKIISEFRGFLMESGSSSSDDFLKLIDDNNNNIGTLISPASFTQDLFNLEMLYFKNSAKINYLEKYEFLLNRTNVYILLNHEKLNAGEKKVLKFVCASTISKIITLRDKQHSSTAVVDIGAYLNAISSSILKLKETTALVVVNQLKDEFISKIDAKISQAYHFISTVALPSIGKVETLMEEKTEKVIREINSYATIAEQDLHVRERKENDLKEALLLKKVFSGLSIVGSLISFAGPKGLVIGSGIRRVASSIRESMLPPNRFTPLPSLEYPEAFQHNLMNNSFVNTDHRKYLAERIPSIQIQINTTVKFISEYRAYFSEDDNFIPIKISELRNVLQRLQQLVKSDLADPVEIYEVRQRLELAHGHFVKLLKSKQDQLLRREYGDTANIASTLGEIIASVSLVDANPKLYDAVQTFQKTEREIVEMMVEQSEQQIRRIDKRKQSIYNLFIPLFKASIENAVRAGNSLSNTTGRVGTVVWKRKVRGMLHELRLNLRSFVKGLRVEEEILLCVDKLDESIAMLIDLYELIGKHEETKDLVSYLGQISAPNSRTIQVEPQLGRIITKTEHLLTMNLFLLDYEKAIGAFKQWVFPFARKYLLQDTLLSTNRVLLANLQNETLNLPMSINLTEVASEYTERIKRLQDYVNRYKSTIVTRDEHLMKSPFSSDVKSSVPFYTWKNEDWSKSIKQLLSGEVIQLKADVWVAAKEDAMRRGAVKFKTVELYLKRRNSSLQNELDSVLENFHLRMTHSGISYYRVLTEAYVMLSGNQTFRYSFDKLGRNVVHDKYEKVGDYLLSPYSLWTFQLIDMSSKGALTELSSYVSEIDLELRGEGMFIDEFVTNQGILNDLRLKEFYDEVNLDSL